MRFWFARQVPVTREAAVLVATAAAGVNNTGMVGTELVRAWCTPEMQEGFSPPSEAKNLFPFVMQRWERGLNSARQLASSREANWGPEVAGRRAPEACRSRPMEKVPGGPHFGPPGELIAAWTKPAIRTHTSGQTASAGPNRRQGSCQKSREQRCPSPGWRSSGG